MILRMSMLQKATLISLGGCITIFCWFSMTGRTSLTELQQDVKVLQAEVRHNSEAMKKTSDVLTSFSKTLQKLGNTKVAKKPHLKLKEPRNVHTVPAPADSSAMCQSVFPPTTAVQPFGCGGAGANSVAQIACECYQPILISCDDSLDTARDKFYTHVMRDHCTCSLSRRFGKRTDGGWELCMAGPYAPTKSNCLIYSVGIRNDWSFDDAISTEYGCNVMAFDPSIGQDDHKHSDKVWFYNIGLDGKDDEENSLGWKMRTLGSLFKQLSHVNKTIDMVKFDIEFCEWSSIAAMLKENALTHVKQIAFEIHTWRDTKEDYIYFWTQLQGLEDAGFQRWRHQHLNWRCFHPDGMKRYCPQVNMNFINTNFMRH